MDEHDDLDELFSEMTGEHPFARATIARGKLTLNGWTPWLITGGPAACQLEATMRRHVTLADLTKCGEDCDELIVTWVPDEAGDEEATRVLVRWARTVGYGRIWFPGDVVELGPAVTTRRATATCPACRTRWSDAGADFWSGVRAAGYFPGACAVCGGSLPEWSVEPVRLEESDAANDQVGAMQGSEVS